MVVGDDVRFYVTDGQHRITAIRGHGSDRAAIPGLVDADAGFENDSLAVLIVVEEDLKRIHQDFADAAQTKQIPASLLDVYNTREPVNGVLARRPHSLPRRPRRRHLQDAAEGVVASSR
ncbi:hypothetical protein IU449_22000 [Nocardia higoensis]|uniref:DGQHR domain-containing protein n=2 Tax=Nocardia higoensis TaxID=228599 RepID=A0ABS0DH52_9NOCA|nr:DNA sulfur modification protein DndB [Nocardia higoensis]MBF6357183.1 hypothetical protein [Nocardia higoensis]